MKIGVGAADDKGVVEVTGDIEKVLKEEMERRHLLALDTSLCKAFNAPIADAQGVGAQGVGLCMDMATALPSPSHVLAQSKVKADAGDNGFFSETEPACKYKPG